MGLPEKNSFILSDVNSGKYLLDCYQSSIDHGDLYPDPHQKKVIIQLQHIFNESLISPPQKNTFYFGQWFSQSKPRDCKKGLYLWGGVGRGKTHLIDCFYKILPGKKKLRLHFHRFMRLVHEELHTLSGISEPLHRVAENIAKKANILCLDEMHVNDIADAMLLGRLFEHLFEHGVVLITTSNIPPELLYKGGLQRDRFLPAITLLEQFTTVMEMGGEQDYRSRALEQNGLYHISSSQFTGQRMKNYFQQSSGIELHQDRNDIIINKRHIPVKSWSGGVVWFDFDELCLSPRSAGDYTEIATFFHTVMISDIPVMGSSMNDAARRFVNLIDILYDSNVNLVISAEVEAEEIYVSDKLKFEFQRTLSRLKEMQSKKYLTTEHLISNR